MYEVVWKATDSWGQTKEQCMVFYGVELSGYPLLLGIPEMQELQLVLYIADQTWRYHIDPRGLHTVSPRKFVWLA